MRNPTVEEIGEERYSKYMETLDAIDKKNCYEGHEAAEIEKKRLQLEGNRKQRRYREAMERKRRKL